MTSIDDDELAAHLVDDGTFTADPGCSGYEDVDYLSERSGGDGG